jgi:hypothetical protein
MLLVHQMSQFEHGLCKQRVRMDAPRTPDEPVRASSVDAGAGAGHHGMDKLSPQCNRARFERAGVVCLPCWTLSRN